jgi:uncharacterized protein YegL
MRTCLRSLFFFALLLLAAPAPKPVAATPLPQGVGCTISGDKVASPARVRLGEEVQIELTLTPTCPPDSFRTVDAVLAIDRSRSMSGAKLAAAKAAAKSFVDATDLSLQRIGLVTFDGNAWLGINLSQDADAIKKAIDGFGLGSGTNISAAIDKSWSEVLEPYLRPGALPVIIVMGDGEPNAPSGAVSPDVAALRSANAARLGGAVIYTIGLGNDAGNELLIQIAGGEANYYFAPSDAELEAIYRDIALQVGNAAVRDMVLDDDLSADVEYVAGSGRPAPSEILNGGRRLRWSANLVPAAGIKYVYKVKPKRIGTYPTNDLALARFINAESGSDEFTFPKPIITVIEPPAAPAACNGVDWWTVMIHSFPDGVGVSGGSIPRGCNNRFDSGDWADGTRYPLPALEYELATADGSEVIYRGNGVPGPGRVDQRIYIRTCQPPPYRLRLLTTRLDGYQLCGNVLAERMITSRDFRPLAFRRTEVRFGFQRGGQPGLDLD